MKTALTIAGSDSSGGAGIQADLKAMTMNGVFAMSAITALTAQNTTGVSGIFEVSPEFLAQQIDAVFTDIRPCAVKIGMVSSAPLIETIAARLRFYKAEHIVVDPVMVATSGSDLIASDAVRTLRRELFPLAEVITPNRHEAEVLSGLHGPSPPTAAVPSCSRAATVTPTPTICSPSRMARRSGFRVSVSPTPTPTARAALCPVPLRPTLPKDLHWKKRLPGPRLT